jgi:hypothetical protein
MNSDTPPTEQTEAHMRSAFRVGMLALGLQFAAAGMVYTGGRQVFSVVIGLAVAVASFTKIADRFSDSAVRDRNDRYMRIGSVLLPALMLFISLIIPITFLFSYLQGTAIGSNQFISIALYVLAALASLISLVQHASWFRDTRV